MWTQNTFWYILYILFSLESQNPPSYQVNAPFPQQQQHYAEFRPKDLYHDYVPKQLYGNDEPCMYPNTIDSHRTLTVIHENSCVFV